MRLTQAKKSLVASDINSFVIFGINFFIQAAAVLLLGAFDFLKQHSPMRLMSLPRKEMSGKKNQDEYHA